MSQNVESPLSEDNVKHVTWWSTILGKGANIRLANCSQAVVGSGKGNPMHLMKEIKDQISQLEEEDKRVQATMGMTANLWTQMRTLSS
jgi:hypothetical protein